jgi:translation initiation factor 2 beta subunit (eIF-2beta)/eIF-5
MSYGSPRSSRGGGVSNAGCDGSATLGDHAGTIQRTGRDDESRPKYEKQYAVAPLEQSCSLAVRNLGLAALISQEICSVLVGMATKDACEEVLEAMITRHIHIEMCERLAAQSIARQTDAHLLSKAQLSKLPRAFPERAQFRPAVPYSPKV